MGLFSVVNEHTLEECDPMEDVLERLPELVRGKDFYCTCPSGVHGYTMYLEGDTAEDVIAGLPPEWRKGTRVIPVEVFKLPG